MILYGKCKMVGFVAIVGLFFGLVNYAGVASATVTYCASFSGCDTKFYNGTKQYFGANASWNRGNVNLSPSGYTDLTGELTETIRLQAHCFSGGGIYAGFEWFNNNPDNSHFYGYTDTGGVDHITFVGIKNGTGTNTTDSYYISWNGVNRYDVVIDGYSVGNSSAFGAMGGLSCIALTGESSLGNFEIPSASTVVMSSTGRTSTGATLTWGTGTGQTDHPPFQAATYGAGNWEWHTG